MLTDRVPLYFGIGHLWIWPCTLTRDAPDSSCKRCFWRPWDPRAIFASILLDIDRKPMSPFSGVDPIGICAWLTLSPFVCWLFLNEQYPLMWHFSTHILLMMNLSLMLLIIEIRMTRSDPLQFFLFAMNTSSEASLHLTTHNPFIILFILFSSKRTNQQSFSFLNNSHLFYLLKSSSFSSFTWMQGWTTILYHPVNKLLGKKWKNISHHY